MSLENDGLRIYRYQNTLNLFASNLTVKKFKDSNIFKICLTLEFISYLCVGFIITTFLATYSNYNSAFYAVETDYKKWVTALPSYTICPVVDHPSFAKYLQRIIRINNNVKLEFVTGLLDPSKGYCRNCTKHNNFLPKRKFRKIVGEVSQLCEGLLLNCHWKGKPFQCCHFFQRIPTNTGVCFSINSVHVKDPNSVPSDMVTSFNHPEAVLEVETSTAIKAYLHDRKELDFQNSSEVKIISPGEHGKILYKFTEVIEDDTSWLINMNQRNCVLTGEISAEGFNVYSESACLINCMARKQKSMCKCKHHLLARPGPEPDCDYQGLLCLDKKFDKKWISYFLNDCDCLPDCSYTDINYIQYSVKRSLKKTASVSIHLAQPPTERLKLISKVTTLDVIIMIACLSRLFTNATFEEMIYVSYWSTKEFFFLTQDTLKSLIFDNKKKLK